MNGASGALRVVWGYRVWLVVVALATLVTSYVLSDRGASLYAASTPTEVISGRQVAGDFVSSDELLQLTSVQLELARTRPVGDAARKALLSKKLPATATIDVSAQPQVRELLFTGRSTDPATAAAYANAYADAFVAYLDGRNEARRQEALDRIQARVEAIQAQLDAKGLTAGQPAAFAYNSELDVLQTRAADLQVQSVDGARVIQQATVPSTPYSPKPRRDATLATIAALVLAGLAIAARTQLSGRYSSADEAAEDLRLPLLGEIPRLPGDNPLYIEALRSLRTNVAFALRDITHPALVVTSATPKAGKTHLSTSLARALAADGAAIVVVDADLRRPTVHERLQIPLQPGIGDLVAGDAPDVTELSVQPIALSPAVASRGGRLDAVAAGRRVVDPAEALAGETMRRALRSLRAAYDIVVIDSPPALAVADPVVLARQANAVIFVLDGRRERRDDARRALQTLRAVEANVIGLVYNGSQRERRRYAYHPAEAQPPLDVAS